MFNAGMRTENPLSTRATVTVTGAIGVGAARNPGQSSRGGRVSFAKWNVLPSALHHDDPVVSEDPARRSSHEIPSVPPFAQCAFTSGSTSIDARDSNNSGFHNRSRPMRRSERDELCGERAMHSLSRGHVATLSVPPHVVGPPTGPQPMGGSVASMRLHGLVSGGSIVPASKSGSRRRGAELVHPASTRATSAREVTARYPRRTRRT